MVADPLRRLVGPAVLCAGIVATLALGLADAQRSARAELDRRYAEAARTTAGMVDALFAATTRQAVAGLEERYRDRVTDGALAVSARRAGAAYALVAGTDGNLVAASPGAPFLAARRASEALSAPGSGRPGAHRLSGIHHVDGRPVLEWIVPFRSDRGPRVHVTGLAADRVAALLTDALRSAGGVRALVLDSRGHVVGDSEGVPTPGRPPAPGTITAAGDGDPTTAGHRVGRTPLRVVLVQPRDGLYAAMDGGTRWLPWLALALASGAMGIGLVLLGRLARSHRDLRRSEERYALALRGAQDVLWDWDLASGRLHLSDRWAQLVGAEAGEPPDSFTVWLERMHPDDRDGFEAAVRAHVTGLADVLDHEHRLRRADGSHLWTRVRGCALFDADDRAYRIAGSLTDVTARRHTVARLEHQANHDALTGLANRTRFFELLERAIERSTRAEAEPCAVVFLDLDGFKSINDRHGHLVGDRLLAAVARRLEAHVRPGDVVGRLGGDELAVLVARVADACEAEAVAERLVAAVGEPYALEGMSVRVGASAGVAVAGPGDEAEELVQLADAAMYRAKLAA